MRKLNRESGQALVEFALTALFVIFLILAFLESILMFYTYIVLADSAKEGVRYAIVHGSSAVFQNGPAKGGGISNPPCLSSSTNVAAVQAAVIDYAKLSLHNPGNIAVDVCYFDGDNITPDRVGVTVHYPYHPFFNMGWPT